MSRANLTRIRLVAASSRPHSQMVVGALRGLMRLDCMTVAQHFQLLLLRVMVVCLQALLTLDEHTIFSFSALLSVKFRICLGRATTRGLSRHLVELALHL